MGKFTIHVPRFRVIIRNVASMFWDGARVYTVDATIFVLTFISIIWWAFDSNVQLEGAAGFLLIYSFGVVIRLREFRIRLKEAESKIRRNIENDIK
jgi:hypothetical protein